MAKKAAISGISMGSPTPGGELPLSAQYRGPVASDLGQLRDLISAGPDAPMGPPMVLFSAFNFDAPLSDVSYNFLAQEEIDIFASPNNTNIENQVVTQRKSIALSPSTLTMDCPFALVGVCMYIFGEGFAFSVPGNWFAPQSAFANEDQIPTSPITLPNDFALISQLCLGAGTTSGITAAAQAVMDWGGPTWRAISYMMRAYRLQMLSPGSNYTTLIDESLADIGNCIGNTEFDGFAGDVQNSTMHYARMLNNRLVSIRTDEGGLPTAGPVPAAAGQDPGYFVPINADVSYDSAGRLTTILPHNATQAGIAYGRAFTEPTYEKWFKLPNVIPLDRTTKIKFILNRRQGDDQYFDRMIEELSVKVAEQPVPGLASSNANEFNHYISPAISGSSIGAQTSLPFGKISIGVGLKGFVITPDCAKALQDSMLQQYGLAGIQRSPLPQRRG